MPLVDYDSSDEGSENEKEVEETKEENLPKVPAEDVTSNKNSEGNATLFSSLPKPKKSYSFLGEDNKLSKMILNKDDALPLGKKSQGESIKITVPSVSEFENDGDQPPAKKLKPSANGVGLFSVLPPPKNNAVKESNRTLVPHVVAKNQKKPVQPTVSSTLNAETNSPSLSSAKFEEENDVEESDDETEVGNSFFGSTLYEPGASTESEGTSNDYTYYANTHNQSTEINHMYVGDQPQPEQEIGSTSTSNDANNFDYSLDSIPLPESIPLENNPLKLDEKALQILCGGKKKRQQMPMEIIDLSGEEIMPDSKEWLLKQFTEEKKVRSHTHKKGFGPSSQSRRKHQITYLAYQAKEMEIELQNQWANNRMSRRQTQSKYGF